MYYVNNIVGMLVNPLAIGAGAIILGAILCRCRWRKVAKWLCAFGVVWLWFWSTGAVCRWTGLALESQWLDKDGRIPLVESFPEADIIVILSGGMGIATNRSPYAEMYCGADRVWQGARLFRAGKAKGIVLTGIESRESTIPLLRDFGVPEEAISVDNDSKNSEENAKFTAGILRHEGVASPKILLVTSAFHMKRSVLMFRKYAPEIEVVPAPSDFEIVAGCDEPLTFTSFLPNVHALARNSVHFKEFVGYWGYRLFR